MKRILLMLMLCISVPCFSQTIEHVVDVGETFESIAQKYGLTEQQLKEANPKYRGVFYVGMKLNIPQKKVETKQTTQPQPTVVPQQPAKSEQPAEPQPTVQPQRSDTYTVRETPTYYNRPRNVELSSGSDYEPVDQGLMSFGRSNFTISGRYEEFLNDVFYYYSKRKDIKSQIGIEGTYSIVVFSPFALEVTGFYTQYKVDPLAKSGEKTKVTHAGIEGFATAYFLPYVGKLSDYFAPYAGIGYQTSSLKWGEDVSAGTGGAMVKCGAKIGLGWGIHLRLEYKQTLPKDNNKSFFAFAVGLGCKL
jgi:LysM domain.